ncbi:MAG: ribonuclease HI [Thermoguttaceae bacterium]|nr:ribonuclease HI [Thermoguttaceae bacterium]MDO4859002.1 ribonuclease HI [Thermoguttaceae bacterium]
MPKKTSLPTTVHLFTDGACSGNPGPGGWGCILRHLPTGKEKELSGSEPQTTNNRMELMAVIQGLRQLNRPCGVLVVSDSQYVLNGLEKWMKGWKSKGWRLSDGKPVKNQDLWMELDELKSRHSLTFQYVHGHAGHEENERCDQMAVEAYKKLKK